LTRGWWVGRGERFFAPTRSGCNPGYFFHCNSPLALRTSFTKPAGIDNNATMKFGWPLNKTENTPRSPLIAYSCASTLTLPPKNVWAEIDLLIACANQSGQALTRPLLQEVVETSDKKRFTVSEDALRIRAAQGHSTQSVSIAHVEKRPPEFLYHGTATRFLDSIREQGLLPGSRHYVHLSEDVQTATAVGQRYGKPVVLKVKALQMYQQGIKFYQAENGVWLVKEVSVNQFLV